MHTHKETFSTKATELNMKAHSQRQCGQYKRLCCLKIGRDAAEKKKMHASRFYCSIKAAAHFTHLVLAHFFSFFSTSFHFISFVLVFFVSS